MPLRTDSDLPSIENVTGWILGPEFKDPDLAGRPVLVHFWSISCPTCKETLPDVNRWREQWVPQGLILISVHVPMYLEDTDIELVEKTAKAYNMVHSIAIDNNSALSQAFQNEYVPAFYLFDSKGKMRFRASGHSGIALVEDRIEKVMSAVTV